MGLIKSGRQIEQPPRLDKHAQALAALGSIALAKALDPRFGPSPEPGTSLKNIEKSWEAQGAIAKSATMGARERGVAKASRRLRHLCRQRERGASSEG